MTKTYRDINPYEFSDETIVSDALKELQKYKYMSLNFPFWVKFAENPKYSFLNRNILFIPGAVNEVTHDIIHLILGRGFYPEDEAFVVGFTFGSTQKWGILANLVYKVVAKYLYPEEYKFNKNQLKILEMATKAGKETSLIDLSTLLPSKVKHMTIKELRNKYIKNWTEIMRFYSIELDMVGNEVTHARLRKII